MTATPNIELDLLPVGGSTQDQATVNENSVVLSALVQSRVNDKDLTAPPGGETNGLSFIVGPAATGAWAGHDDDIAVWIELVAGSGFWNFHTPLQGWSTFIVDENKRYEYTGSAWQIMAAGGGLANVVDDVSPQLGGMLDINGQTIGDGVSAILSFVEDAFAVNNVEIENEASGSGPIIRAVGADANIDLLINAKGTGNVLFDGSNVVFGDPGVEGSGITIGGVTYNSSLKVSGIGGSDLAQTILHRHSTTLPPAIVTARSHSNTSSHSIVLDGDILFGLYAAGHDGVDYELAASIVMEVDGTPGSNDMPGRIIFSTTPDGSASPREVLRLSSAGVMGLSFEDSGVATTPVMQTFSRTTSGTAADNIGGQLLFQAENDVGALENAAALIYQLADVSDGAELGKMIFQVFNAGVAEDALSIDTEGVTVLRDMTIIGETLFTGAMQANKNFRVTDADLTKTGQIALNLGRMSTALTGSTECFIGPANTGGPGGAAGDLLFVSRGTSAAFGHRWFTNDTQRMYLLNGLVVGAPTGGDKGVGSINAQAVYDDNTLLTDYVFEHFLYGKAKDTHSRALAFNTDHLDVDKYASAWKKALALPNMPTRIEFEKQGMSVGDISQRLWETTEVMAVHIHKLNERLKIIETV